MYLPIYFICLSSFPSVNLSITLSVYLSVSSISINLPNSLSIPKIWINPEGMMLCSSDLMSIYLTIYVSSSYLSVYLSNTLSVYLSVSSISINLPNSLSIPKIWINPEGWMLCSSV